MILSSSILLALLFPDAFSGAGANAAEQALGTPTLPAIHLEPREGRAHAFVDAHGRETIFHGTAAVVKGPPWYPDHSVFSRDISMAARDFEWMQELGLNFLRLGVMWPGYEPQRGQYNETYLDQIDAVVALAAKHGVYIILDAHQDGLSEYFCGEGLPHWAVKKSGENSTGIRWWDLLTGKAPWPQPFDSMVDFSEKCGNASCTYTEPKHENAVFPTTFACNNLMHGPSFGEAVMETAMAYQALYDNWEGVQDQFVEFWRRVAKRFAGRGEVVGLNLINEPFAGDFYRNPLMMLPYPNPFSADRINLQPLYDRVNDAVRHVNSDVLLFVAGVTWGDLGSGFSRPPGGWAYANKTVVTYHYYKPPQHGAEQQVASHLQEAVRLQSGAMLTETESLWHGDEGANEMANACDHHLQGWADWEWKSFWRQNEPGVDDDMRVAADKVSQYGAWGSGKTGHGLNWEGPDSPPSYYNRTLARTYAPRVRGIVRSMRFDAASGDFKLVYSSTTSFSSSLMSQEEKEDDHSSPLPEAEIFLLPSRYPDGAEVTASASDGNGLRLSYKAGDSWVRVFADKTLSALSLDESRTVTVSRKRTNSCMILQILASERAPARLRTQSHTSMRTSMTEPPFLAEKPMPLHLRSNWRGYWRRFQKSECTEGASRADLK